MNDLLKLRDFISQWIHIGNLQTFESRESFRTAGARVLEQTTPRITRSTFLTIQQEGAIKFAYEDLKSVIENNPQVDREDLEDTMELLENAFPTLNLETIE